MELKWDLLPVDQRQAIRDAMVEEMKHTLKAQRPDATAESIERSAIHLTNVAISRERKRQKREVAWQS